MTRVPFLILIKGEKRIGKETFIKKYWDICSGYIFFHYTYRDGSPNVLHDIILDNVTGNPFIFDIVEPHKKRQGSITMVKKNDYV